MKSLLIILDGMGLSEQTKGNATHAQSMPFTHSLMTEYGYCNLAASGPDIGLDEGQAGNSEIGHLTIGAGRRLDTMLSRVRGAYADGTWAQDPLWSRVAISPRIHIVGLLSDAGVHSHWTNMLQSIELASKSTRDVTVCVHALLDGVDSPAGSALELLAKLQTHIATFCNVELVTVMGRKWGCDRGGDLSITEHCLAGLSGEQVNETYSEARLTAHLASSGSEWDFPCHVVNKGNTLCAGEAVLLTHHRADRISQLAQVLKRDHEVYSLIELNAEAVAFENVFFPIVPIAGGLIAQLHAEKISPVRIAESCKFPHVTFFMNGLQDAEDECIEIPSIPEDQIPSNPVMSLELLKSALLEQLAVAGNRSVIVNIPNLDQVGHVGQLELAKQAAQYVDSAVRDIYQTCQSLGWNLVLTADHGNADCMLDSNGDPLGSHSSNPVPLVVIPQKGRYITSGEKGTLADVAAVYLSTLGLSVPKGFSQSLVGEVKI